MKEIADLLANRRTQPLPPGFQGKSGYGSPAAETVAQAEVAIADLESKLRARLGRTIYRVDDETLEAVVVSLPQRTR